MNDTNPLENSTSTAGASPGGGARLRRNLIAAGAGIGIVALAAVLLIPRPAAEDEHGVIPTDFVPEQVDAITERETYWLREAGLSESLEHPGQVQEAISRIRAHVDDPDRLLHPDSLEALFDTIAEHAAARAERSPDRYLALCRAESDLYQWSSIDPGTTVGVFLDYWGLGDPTTDGAEDALRRIWEFFYDTRGDRIDAIGAPPHGARVVVRKVRTAEQSREQFFKDGEEMRAWNDRLMLTAALPLRTPKHGIDEALREQPGVTVVQCMIVVRLANGSPINWISSWFEDPSTGRWVCSWMARKRGRLTSLVF